MSSVDNRIVKMSFDNAEFEKKVGTTLDTLKKLRESLDFSGATKGMEAIQNTSNQVKFDALVNGVEALQSRFSVLGEFVHNVFMNMVNNAVDAGKQIANALVLNPIKEGFAEYELQMGAIQTILAGARTNEGLPVTLDLVNQKLDELNAYADKTIYSFSDMTQNIGKFTNAGVGLEDAVAAIQGVSNVAALSGANAQQASHAMYNFAQALSSGYVKLIDWKSIETANMATVGFKDTLIQTGLAMGTLVKVGDKYQTTTTNAQGKVSDLFNETIGFNDALQNQWMTTDVLTQALKIYSTNVEELSDTEKEAYEKELEGLGYTKEQIAALEELGIKAAAAAKDVKTFSQLIDTLKEALGSGWTKSWQYVIGDFEEAKELWTAINDILSDYINKSADARNEMLKAWSEGGGRAAVVDSLLNTFNALVSVMTPLKQAWDDIFPAVKADDLIKYSKALKTFTQGLKLTKTEANSLRSTAFLLFSFLHQAIDGVVNIGKSLFDVLKTIGGAIDKAFGLTYVSRIGMITSRFKEFTELIKPSEKVLEGFGKLLTGILSILRAVVYIAVDFGSAVFDGFVKVFKGLQPDLENFMDLLGTFGDFLGEIAKVLQDNLNFNAFSGGFSSLAEALLNVWNAAKNFLGLDGVINWFKNLFDVTKGGKPSLDILGFVADMFGKITKALADFTSKIDLKSLDLAKVLNLAANTAIFKKIYDIFSTIQKKLESEAPKTWLQSLKDTIETSLKGAGELLTTFKETIIDVANAIETKIKADTLQKVAIAFAVLVGSLWVLSTIDAGKLAQSIAALTILLMEVSRMMEFLSVLNVANLRGVSSISWSLIKMAAAIGILAVAIKLMGSMKPDEISQSLLTITILIGELSMVAKMFGNMDGDMKKGAGSLILFAGALRILVSSVKELGEMDPTQLLHGMEAVLTLLASLVVVSKKLNTNLDPSQLKSVATGLVIFSIAIKVLASVVKDFAALNLEELAKGLGGLVVLITMLVYTSRTIPTDFVSPGQIIKISEGLLIFCVAVKMLASVVKEFSTLDLGQLAIGLGGLAGVMAALVLSAEHLDSIDVKSLLGSVVGLLLFVEVIKSVANVVVQLSAIPFDQMIVGLGGLAAIMIGLAAAAVVFSSSAMDPTKITGVGNALLAFSLSVGIMAASLKLLSTIPWQVLLVSLGSIVAMFAIIGGATAILGPMVPAMIGLAGAMTLFGASLFLVGAGVGIAATGFATLVGAIAAGGYVIIDILHQLIGIMGEFGAGLANMFTGFVTTLASQGPALVMAISTIIQTVLAAIAASIPAITETLFVLLSAIVTQLATYIPIMANAALQFIGGFLQAVAANLPQILDSAITIIVTFVNGIASRLGEIIQSAFNLIISFINGLATAINNNHGAIRAAIGNLIRAIVNAIIAGIVDVVNSAKKLVSRFASNLNPADVMSKIYSAGKNLIQGFINGITSMGSAIWNAAANIASKAWNAVTSTLKEHSPSRLAFGGGVNFILGFINGMNDMERDTEKTAAGVAYGALTAFSDGLDKMDNTLYSPTIVPVIDDSSFGKGFDNSMKALDNRLHSSITIDTLNYTGALIDQMSAFTNTNRKLVESINDIAIDYDKLGVSVANALVNSGVHVEMDGGKLMGYIAGEVRTARHQFI